MVPDYRGTCRQTRRIGLIGGMSWRSTALYYERLNGLLEVRQGAHSSFRGQVWNLNYADLLAMVSAGDETGIETVLIEAASGLAQAGCEVVALTAVTAHRWHEAVQTVVAGIVPHVLAGAARRLEMLGVRTVGVLGTGMTCGSAFVRDRLAVRERTLLFLEAGEQAEIDHLIQVILTTGGDHASGRKVLCKAIDGLKARGAEAVVLACTELPLLLPVAETEVPLIDCVALHADDICNLILSETHAR